MIEQIDRYLDDFEKSIEDVLRSSFKSEGGDEFLSHPIVTGLALALSPEGRPSVRFFGDDPQASDGVRSPIYEQFVDEDGGRLRLIVELPGVEKENVQISALENTVSLKAENSARKYRIEIPIERDIDPESGTATCRNGLLEAVFSLREKTNKGYRRVSVV